MSELLLYYMCDEGYDYFIPLFTYFASCSNPNAMMEIRTPEIEKFKFLTGLFDLEMYPLEKHPPNINMLRFLTEPNRKATYTYIGDIDILLMEDILSQHKHLVNKAIPVSNILRPSGNRVSGLQFVLSDPYFNDVRELREEFLQTLYPKRLNDEFVLYKLIDKVYGVDSLKLLNPKELRPVMGIHASPNRHPYQCPCPWGLSEAYRLQAVEWMNRKAFRIIEKNLQPKAKKIIDFIRNPNTGWS